MLAIRLQRVGRKGHAMYRLAVQESRRHPSSGNVVAYVGTYDPHTKAAKIQVELAQKYLDNGAQPSPRLIKLLSDAGVKMPNWVVKFDNKQSKVVRNGEKLRKNRPKVEKSEKAEVVEVAEPVEEEVTEVETVESEIPEVSETDESAETTAQE